MQGKWRLFLPPQTFSALRRQTPRLHLRTLQTPFNAAIVDTHTWNTFLHLHISDSVPSGQLFTAQRKFSSAFTGPMPANTLLLQALAAPPDLVWSPAFLYSVPPSGRWFTAQRKQNSPLHRCTQIEPLVLYSCAFQFLERWKTDILDF